MIEAFADVAEVASEIVNFNTETADKVLDRMNNFVSENEKSEPSEMYEEKYGNDIAHAVDSVLDKFNNLMDSDSEIDSNDTDVYNVGHSESLLDKFNESMLDAFDKSNEENKDLSLPEKGKTTDVNNEKLDSETEGYSDEIVEQEADNAEKPEQIKCRNENLEGQKHPETGIPFERKQVEVDGKQYEVVVPVFESLYDAQLPKDLYEASDREQFKECNAQLKNEIANNKELRDKFDEEQLEQIENCETPDGYTWHHDAEAGKMQLVETETHQKTGHTGGRSIWGGGTESR